MAENLRTRQVTYIATILNFTFAYDHITEKVPVLVRSPQSNPVERGYYLDGRPPGNTPCCRL